VAQVSELRIGVASDAEAGVGWDEHHDAVVRPLGLVAERPCTRPACAAPSIATLSFSYLTREAWLAPLTDDRRAPAYDLCAAHAAHTRAPLGWHLHDLRPTDEDRAALPSSPPADLGGDRTVAVLAAALRAVPDAVSEDAVRDAAVEAGGVPAAGSPRPVRTKPVLVVRDRTSGRRASRPRTSRR
jgi:hypothetical protein